MTDSETRNCGTWRPEKVYLANHPNRGRYEPDQEPAWLLGIGCESCRARHTGVNSKPKARLEADDTYYSCLSVSRLIVGWHCGIESLQQGGGLGLELYLIPRLGSPTSNLSVDRPLALIGSFFSFLMTGQGREANGDLTGESTANRPTRDIGLFTCRLGAGKRSMIMWIAEMAGTSQQAKSVGNACVIQYVQL